MTPSEACVRRSDRRVRVRRSPWGWLAYPAAALTLGLGALAGPWANVAALGPERRFGLGLRASLLVAALTLIASQAGFWRGDDRRRWTTLGVPGAALAALAAWHARRAMAFWTLVAAGGVAAWPTIEEALAWGLWWATSVAWFPEVAVVGMVAIAGASGRPGGAPWLDALRGSSPPESAGVLVGSALPFVVYGALSTAFATLLSSGGPRVAVAATLVGSVVLRGVALWLWRRHAAAAHDVARALALSDLRDDVVQEAAAPGAAPWESWLAADASTSRLAWRRVWRRRRPQVLFGLAVATVTPWLAAGWERELVVVAFPALLGHAVLADRATVPAWWRRWLGDATLGSMSLWWRLVGPPVVAVALVGTANGAWSAPSAIAPLVLGPALQRVAVPLLGSRAAWAGGAFAWLIGAVWGACDAMEGGP